MMLRSYSLDAQSLKDRLDTCQAVLNHPNLNLVCSLLDKYKIISKENIDYLLQWQEPVLIQAVVELYQKGKIHLNFDEYVTAFKNGNCEDAQELLDFIKTINPLTLQEFFKSPLALSNPYPCMQLVMLLKQVNFDIRPQSFWLLCNASLKVLIHLVKIGLAKNCLNEGLIELLIHQCLLLEPNSIYQVVWPSLINVFLHFESCDLVLKIYEMIQSEGVLPDQFISWIEKNKKCTITEIYQNCLHLNLKEPFNRDLLYYLVKALPSLQKDDFISVMHHIFNDAPNVFTQYFSQLKSLEIYDGGHSVDQWWKLTATMLERVPPHQENKKHSFYDQSLSFFKQLFTQNKVERTMSLKDDLLYGHYKSHYSYQDFKQEIASGNWTFKRLQGRTILLMNPHGDIFALKVKKQNESYAIHAKEFKAQNALHEHAKEIGLLSKLPNPLSVISCYGEELVSLIPLDSAHLRDTPFFNLVKLDPKETYPVFLYKVSRDQADYFTYLHDIALTDQQFRLGNTVAVHDLCKLIAEGIIYPSLADIFHNTNDAYSRRDLGRYIVLANLLVSIDFEAQGSGRLSGWKKAVAYPNIRTGLADLGDYATIEDLMEDGELAKKYFSLAEIAYQDKVGNYLLANIFAEYQYVLLLIAGLRGCELTALIKHVPDHPNRPDKQTMLHTLWKTLAEQVLTNCIDMVHLLTRMPIDEVKRIILSVVNTERLAEQMRFWMTDEHIAYMLKNDIPDAIYGKKVAVVIDNKRFRKDTFDAEYGFSINKPDQDLGPVNGQEPIKEANKLFYWMNTLIFYAYLEYTQLRSELGKVLQEPINSKLFDERRYQLFHYLPPKKYHALQSLLCKKKLQCVDLAPEEKQQVGKQMIYHQQTHSALVIQGFWRAMQRKIPKPALSENRQERCAVPTCG